MGKINIILKKIKSRINLKCIVVLCVCVYWSVGIVGVKMLVPIALMMKVQKVKQQWVN